MSKSARVITDRPVTNALRVDTACGGALILTIITAEKQVMGEGAREGFVDFARLPTPHLTASANLLT